MDSVEESDLAVFGDLSQSKKLSEIKSPLTNAEVNASLINKIDQNSPMEQTLTRLLVFVNLIHMKHQESISYFCR